MRSQVAGDQLKLLSLGWSLIVQGTWLPYGNPTSAGGFSPGGVTALLVGLPLLVWRDPRAATLLVVITHIGAYALLDRLTGARLTPRQRLLFAVFYWLNPWRVFFSGFLWNPNWLFLAGAIHIVTAYRQREESSFGASFAQAATIAVAVQLHLSAVILAIASLLLLVRRRMRVQWQGVVAGGIAGSITLVPWIVAVVRDGLPAPRGGSLALYALLFLQRPLRAIGYWLRYSSMFLLERARQFDFTPAFGTDVDRWLAPAAEWLVIGAGVATVLFALSANIALWRRRDGGTIEDSWIRDYVRLCFVAFLIAAAISPTTPMAWQGIPVFHAAVLALVLAPTPRIAPWFAAGSIAISLLVVLGAPQFRCGGRNDIRHTLQQLHPMLFDFGIQQRCPWPLAPDGGRPIEDTLIGR